MDFRRALLDNLGLKAGSVLLAFLLWLNVASEQVIERTVFAPVEFLNVPVGLEIANEYVRALEVQVSTRRRSLLGSMPTISAVISLQDAREGQRIVPITEGNIRKPDDVAILSITPSRIILVLERSSSRAIPVEPQVSGEPAAGYQLTRVLVDPPVVRVTGPESRVREAPGATTEAIDIAGADRSLRRQVNVGISDSKLRIERAQPVSVELVIEPARTSEHLTVPLEPDRGVRTEVRAVRVQVSFATGGPRPALAPEHFSARLPRPQDAAAGEEREIAPQVEVADALRGRVRVDGVEPRLVKGRIR